MIPFHGSRFNPLAVLVLIRTSPLIKTHCLSTAISKAPTPSLAYTFHFPLFLLFYLSSDHYHTQVKYLIFHKDHIKQHKENYTKFIDACTHNN